MIRRLHACIYSDGHFSAFVVNCEFINNKKSIVIKLGMRTVDVLSVAGKMLLFNVMFHLNSKTTHFRTYAYINFFFVLM